MTTLAQQFTTQMKRRKARLFDLLTVLAKTEPGIYGKWLHDLKDDNSGMLEAESREIVR